MIRLAATTELQEQIVSLHWGELYIFEPIDFLAIRCAKPKGLFLSKPNQLF
jgi:hypothetical protein